MRVSSSEEPLVRLENVTRILPSEPEPVVLVKDINISIMPGEFVSITGPSGSGKSSLIYIIGLLDSLSNGKFYLDGIDTTSASDKRKMQLRLEKIGFVFQFHFLLQEFSALENVILPMQKLGVLSTDDQRKRGLHLLEQFGLGAMGNKRPNQLSGGECQRVAIARALANDPMLIIADEPTGNLDTENSERVFNYFKELTLREGKAVITVTHDLEMAKHTNRQIRLVDGKVSTD